MEYISSFTKTLACVIVTSFILKSLLPRSVLEKYINFVIGLIISVTLVGAFSNVDRIEFDDIMPPKSRAAITEQEARSIYNKKLAEGIELDIKRSVHNVVREVSGCECECDIMLKLDAGGGVVGIEGIYVKVYGYCDSTMLKAAISEKLQVDSKTVYIGGAEDE